MIFSKFFKNIKKWSLTKKMLLVLGVSASVIVATYLAYVGTSYNTSTNNLQNPKQPKLLDNNQPPAHIPELSNPEDQDIPSLLNDDKKIKVGFWNILNYDDNPKLQNKTKQQENIAKVIKRLQPDIIGLVEVNAGDDEKPNTVENLTKLLTEDKKYPYYSITSEIIYGKGNENQKERVSFIYNHKKVSLLEIDKDKKELIDVKQNSSNSNPIIVYENKEFNSVPSYFATKIVNNKLFYDNKPSIKKVDFARPPAGAIFKSNKTQEKMLFVVSHFDAPGVSNSGWKQGHEEGVFAKNDGYDLTNGSQEVSEATQMATVMDWFKNKIEQSAQNSFKNKKELTNTFFMADTNIKAKSHDKAFENLLKSYKSLLSKDNNTSLGKKFGKYSNSYDKIFVNKKSMLNINDADKYPLWNVKKDLIVEDINQNDTSKLVSDHSPVFFTIDQ